MSDRMTTIALGKGSTLSARGRRTVDEMIAQIRADAEHQKRAAEAVLAAPDEAFRVYTHTGVIVRRNREVLQEGEL